MIKKGTSLKLLICADRSICKICAKNIGEGELRFRCNKGYSHSTYIHHAKCFILQYRPKSIEEIAHYDLLSSEDQEIVRQMLQNPLVGEKGVQNGQKLPQKIKVEPQSDEESNEAFSLSGTIRAMNTERKLEIGLSSFPYRVSYGDDGLLLIVCKMCTEIIEKGDINHNDISYFQNFSFFPYQGKSTCARTTDTR